VGRSCWGKKGESIEGGKDHFLKKILGAYSSLQKGRLVVTLQKIRKKALGGKESLYWSGKSTLPFKEGWARIWERTSLSPSTMEKGNSEWRRMQKIRLGRRESHENHTESIREREKKKREKKESCVKWLRKKKRERANEKGGNDAWEVEWKERGRLFAAAKPEGIRERGKNGSVSGKTREEKNRIRKELRRGGGVRLLEE